MPNDETDELREWYAKVPESMHKFPLEAMQTNLALTRECLTDIGDQIEYHTRCLSTLQARQAEVHEEAKQWKAAIDTLTEVMREEEKGS